MEFAIRDDDTSFFTRTEELLSAYDFVAEGPISLSVVPRTVPHHEKGVRPYGEGIPAGFYPVGENPELIAFLKENEYDILLHGYSHEYAQIDGQWFPEMMWKDEGRIRSEMEEGKATLERLFGRPMRVFVAPNNAVDRRAIRAVEALGLNYSGLIHHGDRDLTLRYAANFVKRWSYRIKTGCRIPDVLDYGKHKELVAYPLDSYEKLIEEYRLCRKRNAPFSVYTHYWHLNRDPALKKLLRDVYTYVMDDGAELVALSDCFER